MVLVEVDGVIIDGVDDDKTTADVARRDDDPLKRIEQQLAPEALAMQ